MRPRSSKTARHLRLDSKLTAYTVAGAAALACTPFAKADTVTYVGNVNQTATSAAGTTDVLTLPNSNKITFTPSVTTFAPGETFGSGNANLTGSVELLQNSTNSYPANLAFGAAIDPSSGTFGTSTKLYGVDKSGYFANTSGYLGFYFQDTTGKDYAGWADIQTTYDTTSQAGSITLLSYAYENTAGVALNAGQTVGSNAVGVTPEPSALSLVALGASGLAYLRRRKNALAA